MSEETDWLLVVSCASLLFWSACLRHNNQRAATSDQFSCFIRDLRDWKIAQTINELTLFRVTCNGFGGA